jgi:hypothetical protein
VTRRLDLAEFFRCRGVGAGGAERNGCTEGEVAWRLRAGLVFGNLLSEGGPPSGGPSQTARGRRAARYRVIEL